MAIKNDYSAESWEAVYNAFSQINFTSYDYDTVKESLLAYMKIYYAEYFNDFIESSEFIAILELFAYVCEQMAYRVDMLSHENFITTAQRKQSILRLVKTISYKPSRNIPGRGLVKLNSIRTSETVYDSLGNNLSNKTIYWNDTNNQNWKEQFFIVIDKCLTSKFGQPSKEFQIEDALMQLYTLNNNLDDFRNGVSPFKANGENDSTQMECVPVDLDENGPFERSPDLNAQFSIIYSSDGKGDGSDYTGFLMFVKQGTLIRTDLNIENAISNRRIQLDISGVNDTDVWLYCVDSTNQIIEKWVQADLAENQNLYFNNIENRKKYELETLENDKVAFLFGDGKFSDTPLGKFQIWTRTSSSVANIPANRVVNQPFKFSYFDNKNLKYNVDITFSLTSAIQNSSQTESLEHIRQSAPSTYYAQNRMVNGQDYNTFPLKDSSILRLKTVNRTFAGQPKYIDWNNDSSHKYENVKLFGDDLKLKTKFGFSLTETSKSSRSIVDSDIEPLLQSNGMLMMLNHHSWSVSKGEGIISYPRRQFIEDARQGIYFDVENNPVQQNGWLKEKTMLQGIIDGHWYGEPNEIKTDESGVSYALINYDIKNDYKLWLSELPRKIKYGASEDIYENSYPSGTQGVAYEMIFGLKYNRFLKGVGDFSITDLQVLKGLSKTSTETITIELSSDLTTFTVISNLRGKLENYILGKGKYSEQQDIQPVIDFHISLGDVNRLEAGDAFVLDITYSNNIYNIDTRKFGSHNIECVNLNGYWSLIQDSDITTSRKNGGLGFFSNENAANGPNEITSQFFDANDDKNSWMFLIAPQKNENGTVSSWYIYSRDLKIIASSDTTKFWFNTDGQIIDYDTSLPVFDNIKILKSNFDGQGNILKKSQTYDVVSAVYSDTGVIDFNSLEIIPNNSVTLQQSNGETPDTMIQFQQLSYGSMQYVLTKDMANGVTSVEKVLTYNDIQDVTQTNNTLQITYNGVIFTFEGNNSVSEVINNDYRILRTLYLPSDVAIVEGDIVKVENDGLDFLWSHYSPNTNLIDPSTSNIHDMFVLTSGYYDSVINYVRGYSTYQPEIPTPLELRTSYGYLLENKMLSDTVILHSGKIKLIIGDKANPTVRGKFKVIKAPTATYSNERIKTEILNVINTYFEISNWNFGDKFYATELYSLIHQRLGTQILSVVLVPSYSSHSFGSLFTIDCGHDEIIQSCATIDDIAIVDELSPSVIRQIN